MKKYILSLYLTSSSSWDYDLFIPNILIDNDCSLCEESDFWRKRFWQGRQSDTHNIHSYKGSKNKRIPQNTSMHIYPLYTKNHKQDDIYLINPKLILPKQRPKLLSQSDRLSMNTNDYNPNYRQELQPNISKTKKKKAFSFILCLYKFLAQ